MSLSSTLPPPINVSYDPELYDERSMRGAPEMGALVSAKVAAPPYGQRKGWIPRTEADFGDGGAFPEITVVQYPLGKLKNHVQNPILCTHFRFERLNYSDNFF